MLVKGGLGSGVRARIHADVVLLGLHHETPKVLALDSSWMDPDRKREYSAPKELCCGQDDIPTTTIPIAAIAEII